MTRITHRIFPLVPSSCLEVPANIVKQSFSNRGGTDGGTRFRASKTSRSSSLRDAGDTPATTVNRLALHKLSDEIF